MNHIKKKVFQKVCESQECDKESNCIQMHDEISLKLVGKQGADLSDSGDEWSL